MVASLGLGWARQCTSARDPDSIAGFERVMTTPTTRTSKAHHGSFTSHSNGVECIFEVESVL